MIRPRTVLVAILGLCWLPAAVGDAAAVSFGRNKVQYDTFHWRVLQTEHLEIHFHQGTEELARRAADYGEAACRQLDEKLGQELTRRIPVILYGSHHRFRQNNVTPALVGESTGGFTEIFRNRVVMPYSGSEPDFRHVLHHELVHAYVFDRFYGGTLRSLFVMQHAMYVPLWFMEGIAEYYSNTWDSEGEMMLRDAALHGGLPPFQHIHGGYFVYKAGASAVGYLVAHHGEEVIPRILDQLEVTRNLSLAVKYSTGENLTELGGDWLKQVRKRTWPTIAELDEADTYGRVLAGGAEGVDSDPVLSPDGSRMAFLSTRSGTPDLWVAETGEDADATPRVLVRGARGGEFESLHPLHASVGWSPEGRFVAAAAQKGPRDALYVIDVERGKAIGEITPDLDAVERPDWSPDGRWLVFTGMRNGQVDLWKVDVAGEGLAPLTDDLFEDRGPRWSPDGTRVLFTSDRGEDSGRDVYVLEVASGEVRPLAERAGDQWDACWGPDGGVVYHVTDEWGTRDLVRHDLASGERTRLTKLVGGATSPSVARSSGQLAFTAYERGRFRTVFVEEPELLREVETAALDVGEAFWPAEPWPLEELPPSPGVVAVLVGASRDPAGGEAGGVGAFVAGVGAEGAAGDDPYGTNGDSADAGVPAAEAELVDYRTRFRPEWMAGTLGYGGFGFHLGVRSELSDVLGDRRATIGANLFQRVENTDVFASYSDLRRRVDWNVSAFHFRDFLWDDRTTLGQPVGEEGEDSRFSERQWGAGVSASFPFHTFRRLEFEFTVPTIEREQYADRRRTELVERTQGTVLLPRLSHTFDNTLWGHTGPVQGARSVAFAQYARPVAGEAVEFTTAAFDVRRYWRFQREYVLAFRAMASSSFGPDPQEFQLGGPNTIRGHARQSIRGRNAALMSLEYRYPFVDYVKLGWPLRAAFGGVRGDLFLDVGTAFDDPGRARLTHAREEDGRNALDDLHVGFGFGARMRVAYFPLRVDVGWATDGISVSSPTWHFALGPEY